MKAALHIIARFRTVQPVQSCRSSSYSIIPILLSLLLMSLTLLFTPNFVLAGEPNPVQLEIIPLKQIYTGHDGLIMKLVFMAKAKTKLCLGKNILGQMQFTVGRAGVGKLPLKPLIIKDNSQIFEQPMKVLWLEAGQSVTLRANLKQFSPDGGERWLPGEYNVGAVFNLCEQNQLEPVTDPGRETPIPSIRQGWFMIMS